MNVCSAGPQSTSSDLTSACQPSGKHVHSDIAMTSAQVSNLNDTDFVSMSSVVVNAGPRLALKAQMKAVFTLSSLNPAATVLEKLLFSKVAIYTCGPLLL
jgi:hypothetical protein